MQNNIHAENKRLQYCHCNEIKNASNRVTFDPPPRKGDFSLEGILKQRRANRMTLSPLGGTRHAHESRGVMGGGGGPAGKQLASKVWPILTLSPLSNRSCTAGKLYWRSMPSHLVARLATITSARCCNLSRISRERIAHINLTQCLCPMSAGIYK